MEIFSSESPLLSLFDALKTVAVPKGKGREDEFMVAAGDVRIAVLFGNDRADAAADMGGCFQRTWEPAQS